MALRLPTTRYSARDTKSRIPIEQVYAGHVQSLRLALSFGLVLVTILTIVLVYRSKLHVDQRSFATVIEFAGFALLLSVIASLFNMNLLSGALQAVGMIFYLPIVELILGYACMHHAGPVSDPYLIGLDKEMGFDWLQFYHWLETWPRFAGILFYAYLSFWIQFLTLQFLLIFMGFDARSIRMICYFLIITTAATLIGGWFPAFGAFHTFGIDPFVPSAVDPRFGLMSVKQFAKVLHDPGFVVRVDHAVGLVVFPSIHVAAGILFIWATWSLRWIRWPSLVLNLLMILSALSHGGHYLSAIVAGCALSVGVILCGELLAWLLLRQSDLPPYPAYSR